jgi:hypothetical protein
LQGRSELWPFFEKEKTFGKVLLSKRRNHRRSIMTTTIPQNEALLKNLHEVLEQHRPIFSQERVYLRVVSLILAELFAFGRHTMTQLLMNQGIVLGDLSAWYRLFSRRRFREAAAAEILLAASLEHVAEDELYVVGGDATQTPRSSRKIEGTGYLVNHRTPPFKRGIHLAQRWFNGSWLMPPENGYSRAMPLRWLPAFTEKARRQVSEPCKEGEAAVDFLNWLVMQMKRLGRSGQRILMLGDGSYDTLSMWQHLPSGVILLARSAKNRALFHLPSGTAHGNRKYGARALTPQRFWRARRGWQPVTLLIRGKNRPLQYRVLGPFVRQGAPDIPLMLIMVRGQSYRKRGRQRYREPLPLLVNAVLDDQGNWGLPLPLEDLLFWAWQRWELEVCHRELKSNFGLGEKQCFNPDAAIASVQWSAWVYAVLLLAGYRTFGLSGAPPVPTRWWRGSGRWSFNTLWRAYRAALWGSHDFHRPLPAILDHWLANETLLAHLLHAVYAASRA